MLVREGDFYFQNNIKFFQGGSGLGCRLGRSWAVPTGHQDPPRTPRFRRKVGAFLQAGRFRWLRCYPPPAPSRKGNKWGRVACWYGRGRLFYTSHFKGGAGAPPLEPLYSKPGLSALGGCEGGGAPPRRGVARGSFPLRGIQRGACPPLRVQRRESCSPPNPSHARTLRKEGAALAREGDFYFQNNIKFFQGGRSRLPPRSVLDGAHRAPGPPPPQERT